MKQHSRSSNRRAFLAQMGTAAAITATGSQLFGAQPEPDKSAPAIRKSTHTFKSVGPLAIQADVFRADDDITRPVLFWIHGGALIGGNRAQVSRQVKDAFLNAGYVVVSIDYRLAPETKLPEIIADLRDAYNWLHEKGPTLFHADTRKVAVAGGSAGGYLTLMTGFAVQPRPAALVSLWGYGDLVGDWYSKPSEFYRKQPLVSKDDAWKEMSGSPIADGSINGKQRGKFYLYCRQQGLWPKEVSGFDPKTEDRSFDPYSPVRNISKDYPPTMLIHGTNDTDVPYEQSVMMHKEFTKHGVVHEFITIPNAGHGIRDGDPKVVASAYAAIVPFVDKYVRGGD
ncbi:MAG: alpha/beta hydrolase [Planctomycetaceae bacterium]